MQPPVPLRRSRVLAVSLALALATLAVPGSAIQGASPGWVGEQAYDSSAPDDWEPAIAADPHSPYVYALATRYGTAPLCTGCPSPYIVLKVSADGGATWGPVRPLCACAGDGQFDPLIEVVPSTGQVYATYMRDDFVVFTKSSDHGAHWSTPASTTGQAAWTDKPAMAMSDNGRDVYVSWNGPSDGDPYAAQSHDHGATWTQTKLVDSGRYFYAFDADVASDGTVYFAEASLQYQPIDSNTPVGNVEEHVFISRDHGTSWENHLVAVVKVGLLCGGPNCREDFWIGHAALSADGHGNLVLLYDGAAIEGGLQTISVRRSTDKGRHWSGATTISTVGSEATSPAVESRGNGDVRAWWMETAGNDIHRWNVWYRTSTDGGVHWSAKVKLSDASAGASYKKKGGFRQVYGDYGEIGITNTGKTIAIWGEGTSYFGPGGVWFNRQQ